MKTELKMIYWKSGKFWLGKLEEHPEIMTQGRTLKERDSHQFGHPPLRHQGALGKRTQPPSALAPRLGVWDALAVFRGGYVRPQLPA